MAKKTSRVRRKKKAGQARDPDVDDALAALCGASRTAQKKYARNTQAEAQSIIYCPAITGALIAAQVKAFAMGQPLCRELLFDIANVRLIAS